MAFPKKMCVQKNSIIIGRFLRARKETEDCPRLRRKRGPLLTPVGGAFSLAGVPVEG